MSREYCPRQRGTDSSGKGMAVPSASRRRIRGDEGLLRMERGFDGEGLARYPLQYPANVDHCPFYE
jgi:hypothetical protein